MHWNVVVVQFSCIVSDNVHSLCKIECFTNGNLWQELDKNENKKSTHKICALPWIFSKDVDLFIKALKAQIITQTTKIYFTTGKSM